jgi:DNA invertase Pin-like site-specific DNA recombinase
MYLGQDYELTKIYADEGISGGSVQNRHGLLQCLKDGIDGKFEVIIIHRLSRFGRNALELLNNYKELKKAGIQLFSISEGIDFSTKYGEFMLTMLAAIAQLEKEIIRETMLENRIAKAKRGIPTNGMMPYARTYNRETGEWILNEEKADIIRQIAKEYLEGEPLKALARKYNIDDNNLRVILRDKSGDNWTVRFKDQEPITYIIPRILSDATIAELKERFDFNRKVNRTDIVDKYLLSGFIFCEKCHKPLTGQTPQRDRYNFKYYRHRPHTPCKAFSYIPTAKIEEAVFKAIFENFVDVPSFDKAIKESLPDTKMIAELNLKIKSNEKKLKQVERDLDKLVTIAMDGTLSKETIQARERDLLQEKTRLFDDITEDQNYLATLPSVDEVKEEAERIRMMILEKYGSKEHQEAMSYDDKRKLLHWLFDGKDQDGVKHGIFINATRRGKHQKVDYYLYGRIVGLRTIQGDDYDYNDESEIIRPKSPLEI